MNTRYRKDLLNTLADQTLLPPLFPLVASDVNVLTCSYQKILLQCHWTIILSFISPISSLLSHTLKRCVCVCVSLPQRDSHDRGRWVRKKTPANQRCAAPCFLSRMVSIPQQCDRGCQRNCTNPPVETLIALCLHRLLPTYIKLNLTLPMSFLMALRKETQFPKWKKCDTESNCRPERVCVWPGCFL